MQQYLDLIERVLSEGNERTDRTGTGTIGLFGHQMTFDLAEGFPLLTTKKLHLRSIIHELLWFLQGDTNIDYLHDNKVSIWDEWADDQGDLGPIYGAQWRHWFDPHTGETIDQMQQALELIRKQPDSRRIVVSAWNVADLPLMRLSPCHCLMQYYVQGDTLSLQLYQRSGDIFLGVPFNIASYALLLMMTAQVTGLRAGKFIHTLGDAHIYKNHIEQAQLQLTRSPHPLPTMKLRDRGQSLFDFVYDDFSLTNYNPYPHIPAPVAV